MNSIEKELIALRTIEVEATRPYSSNVESARDFHSCINPNSYLGGLSYFYNFTI